MMTQNLPKFTFKRTVKSLNVQSEKASVIKNKDKSQIDDAYKEFFASLFKIKDKEVHRRVIQAVNGQNLTCANCSYEIQSNGLSRQKQPESPSKFSVATQTLGKDFEFLEKINNTSKTNSTTSTNVEYPILNKIQLGRAKRKVEPYAVKTGHEMRAIPSNKLSYIRYDPGSILNKDRKPKIKTESPSSTQTKPDYSITEKLLFDNLDEQSMSPHGFFNFKPNEEPTKINDFIILSTMEEELRTADVCNEEGLYTIHIATINGDLFKLRRQLVIFKFNKWDIDIRSMDGKKETPLHFAMSCVNNVRNNEIINLLYDYGADVLATNDVGDTILHLAAETVHDYGIITKLLSKISVDDLSKRNDKSQTILHIAASNDNRTFVKLILSFIDEKLKISSIGTAVPFKEANEYFEQLDALHLDYVKTFISENFKKPSINEIKAKILNEQDGRSGKTAIFLSLDNNDKSTCLMLLAHFADTRIQDFSNTSCAFYSTEILKNRVLSQAIYNADSMHNAIVFKTLRQTERHRSSGSRKRLPLGDYDDDDDDGGSDIMTKVVRVLS